jgi:rhodanese-related sulfurtransferase
MNLLVRTALLLLVGAGVGLFGNAVHPSGVPLRKPVFALAEVGMCSASAGTSEAPGGNPAAAEALMPEEIAPQEAMALRFGQGATFGDLRPPMDFAKGHVPDAAHLPCAGTLAVLSGAPRRSPLIVYDGDGRSAELLTAARSAANKGIGKVYILRGGFAAWLAAGLPAESGTCDRCGVP